MYMCDLFDEKYCVEVSQQWFEAARLAEELENEKVG